MKPEVSARQLMTVEFIRKGWLAVERSEPPVFRELGARCARPPATRRSYDRYFLRATNVLVLFALALGFAPETMAQEKVRLECTPRTFRVVPGEPMRLELTVRADSAASIRLHVPGDPALKLRAVEKLPVRRTPQGVIVHRRVIVWQALEPGVVKIDELSVETKGRKLLFPEVTITVRDPGKSKSPP